jgi:hypothetical protein
MAYDIQELKAKALEAIEKNKLFFVEDVIAYLPCQRTYFYDTVKLNKDPEILEMLEKNRVEIKVSMRKKWFVSEHPALQMGLYKLIGTDAEADRLGNKQKVEHSSDSNSPLEIHITTSDSKIATNEADIKP